MSTINMKSRGDNYFVDINFNKYRYCVIDTKGEYVVQAEKWLLNLGLIGKVNGKFEEQDAIAVAYLQKKYNIGANGIIDNKTFGLLWALDDINKHKNDESLELGRRLSLMHIMLPSCINRCRRGTIIPIMRRIISRYIIISC
jgi:hypothetical protein